jgi:hypothetical protein
MSKLRFEHANEHTIDRRVNGKPEVLRLDNYRRQMTVAAIEASNQIGQKFSNSEAAIAQLFAPMSGPGERVFLVRAIGPIERSTLVDAAAVAMGHTLNSDQQDRGLASLWSQCGG